MPRRLTAATDNDVDAVLLDVTGEPRVLLKFTT